ncbi:type IV secretion system DNA-binding domain-containing protein [Bdellovibrionota bacterium FG-1]
MSFGDVQANTKTEIGAGLGITILLAVVGAVYAVGHWDTVTGAYRLLSMLVERDAQLVIAGMGGALLGAGAAVWRIAMLVGRVNGDKSVGAAENSNQSGTGRNTSLLEFQAMGLSVLIALGTYWLLAYVWLPGKLNVFHVKGAYLHFLLDQFFRIAFSIFALIPGYLVGRSPFLRSLLKLSTGRMPKFPRLLDAIVLGSVNEHNLEEKPSWVILGLRGLVGNILVTGSIGSGKTWGTIFSYIRQILTNFRIRPSVLAIDPKGKIAKQIKVIAEELKMEKFILHMKLDGDVTFNPIYQPSALKSGAFSDIAKMVRSAAVNYMGKSFDSSFWEQSAATLVKNCLIYCAATKGYYTLNDLYTAMVRAVSNEKEFIEELAACLKKDTFDEEERANIEFAVQYFRCEYQQLDSKVKTGILATSTSFLNQFQEYQASKIFCPAEKELVIRSMDDVVTEGMLLLFDITNDGLARSMGTFVKLHYEKALLNRLKLGRSTARAGVLIIDEYQDVVTTGYGSDFGDEIFLAEGREANAITIVATQSLSALENAIGRAKPTQVLTSCFRTRILCQATDGATTSAYQSLAGKVDRKQISRSISQHSREDAAGLGFVKKASVSESVSESEQKGDAVTAHDLAILTSYESYAMVYDGVRSFFIKLFLKPDYLQDKRAFHAKIIESMRPVAVPFMVIALASGVLVGGVTTSAEAFPQVCTILKTSEAKSCMDFSVGVCMCGWPIPHPCANFSYFIPQTFIEVMPNERESYFGDLPGAAIQLGAAGKNPVPYGAESDDDTHSYHSHVVSVPFTQIPFDTMPCAGAPNGRPCFEGMSEYLGSNWMTGSADSFQPNFLAWSLSPKGCLVKGAAMSLFGELTVGYPTVSGCAVPMSWMPKYPPSSHSACTGWGTFYPRSGVYNGPSPTTGALMVAARMKSISNEVFHTTPGSLEERWQMIYPQSSSCFREGQNVAILDTIKDVREIGRLTSGKMKGYLFAVWSKVSCCRELAEVPTAVAAIAAMNIVCQGLGSL